MAAPLMGGLQKTTNYWVVLPFYIYASFGFLLGSLLLLLNTGAIAGHYFNPSILAITHSMALAWGTMIIFGASHQLLPVMVEGKLHSDLLGYLTFGLLAIGIPVLIYGFFVFNTGLPLQLGGTLINLGVLCYLMNVIMSSFKSNKRNVHAWFVIMATCWLFATTFLGLLLVFNFQAPIMENDSVYYLSVHAHFGIVGWFLLMVMGVGSRLIPMFMISKYTNVKVLWIIFGLVNVALLGFLLLYLYGCSALLFYIPIGLGLLAIVLFARHCFLAYKVRIRKNVDLQVRTSLISVMQMFLPLAALIIAMSILPFGKFPGIAFIYGFCVFFGWVTAIVLGMTFKTMPFIIWNKVYHNKAHKGRTPVPKEIFNDRLYNIMLYSYLGGFIVFVMGMIVLNQIILKLGALLILMSAILYVYNVVIIATHKSEK